MNHSCPFRTSALLLEGVCKLKKNKYIEEKRIINLEEKINVFTDPTMNFGHLFGEINKLPRRYQSESKQKSLQN